MTKILITLILIITPLYMEAQKRKDVKQFNFAVDQLYEDPDSSLNILNSLLKTYTQSAELYWYKGLIYSYLSFNDKACAHLYIAYNLNSDIGETKQEYENCSSWKNQWLDVLDEYIDNDKGLIIGITLTNNYWYDGGTEMINVGENYILYANSTLKRVKLLRIKQYVFGLGLYFLDEEKNKVEFKMEVYTNANQSAPWRISKVN